MCKPSVLPSPPEQRGDHTPVRPGVPPACELVVASRLLHVMTQAVQFSARLLHSYGDQGIRAHSDTYHPWGCKLQRPQLETLLDH